MARWASTPGTVKLSLVLAAELVVETEHGDGDEEPDADDPERVAGAALAEPVQEL